MIRLDAEAALLAGTSASRLMPARKNWTYHLDGSTMEEINHTNNGPGRCLPQLASGTMPIRAGRTLYCFAVASQLMTLGGTTLIFCALSFFPAGFRVVRSHRGSVAFCLNEQHMETQVIEGEDDVRFMTSACTDLKGGDVASLASFHPRIASSGLALIVGGSFSGLLSIQKPRKVSAWIKRIESFSREWRKKRPNC